MYLFYPSTSAKLLLFLCAIVILLLVRNTHPSPAILNNVLSFSYYYTPHLQRCPHRALYGNMQLGSWRMHELPKPIAAPDGTKTEIRCACHRASSCSVVSTFELDFTCSSGRCARDAFCSMSATNTDSFRASKSRGRGPQAAHHLSAQYSEDSSAAVHVRFRDAARDGASHSSQLAAAACSGLRYTNVMSIANNVVASIWAAPFYGSLQLRFGTL